LSRFPHPCLTINTAFSDDEEQLAGELNQASATKKSGRGKKAASYRDEDPEDDDAEPAGDKKENAAGDDEEEEGDEEEYGADNVQQPLQQSLTESPGSWWRRSCRT
jgi:hypothetical protein